MMIKGAAKICDVKTKECWQVKDGKGTPPIKKTPPKTSKTFKQELRCAIIVKICTDAYSPDIKLINKCIADSKCFAQKKFAF